MPYFHATFADRLSTIQELGLNGADPGPNSVSCERGLYMAERAEAAALICIEHYNHGARRQLSPSEFLQSIRVLVIDDSRIDAALLQVDPHAPSESGCWIYAGIVDAQAIQVLTMDEILLAPFEPPLDELRQ